MDKIHCDCVRCVVARSIADAIDASTASGEPVRLVVPAGGAREAREQLLMAADLVARTATEQAFAGDTWTITMDLL